MAGKRHPAHDIAAKLQQADDMVAKGRTQREIARTLGISIMTYHRWRKLRDEKAPSPSLPAEAPQIEPIQHAREPASDRLAELQVENTRLRRLVTDLLLEKIILQEELEGRDDARRRRRC